MADEEQRGVLNSAELFARMKRTEDSFARRSVERQRAVAARVEGQPLEAEDPLRRARRYVNLGQQPISESEKQLAFERILGTNDMVGVAFVERMLRAIAATGRIVIRTPDGRGGFGTGFLVAPGLLLTNDHVLPSDFDRVALARAVRLRRAGRRPARRSGRVPAAARHASS